MPGRGAFVKPTILTGIGQENELTTTEIFGPVLASESGKDLDEAIEMLSRRSAWRGRDGVEFYTDKKVVIER